MIPPQAEPEEPAASNSARAAGNSRIYQAGSNQYITDTSTTYVIQPGASILGAPVGSSTYAGTSSFAVQDSIHDLTRTHGFVGFWVKASD